VTLGVEPPRLRPPPAETENTGEQFFDFPRPVHRSRTRAPRNVSSALQSNSVAIACVVVILIVGLLAEALLATSGTRSRVRQPARSAAPTLSQLRAAAGLSPWAAGQSRDQSRNGSPVLPNVKRPTVSRAPSAPPSQLPASDLSPAPESPATTTTTLPGQPPAAMSWSAPVELPVSDGRLTSISCPAATLCVATSSGGDLLVSGTPAGGASSWSAIDLAWLSPLGAVSCPTSNFCVVVSRVGVIESTNPTGGPSAWSQTTLPASRIQNGGPWSGVSCPTATFCVAVGRSVMATTSDPAGGTNAWNVFTAPKDVTFKSPDLLTAVSCTTPTFCVAVGALGMVFVSTDPQGGTASWQGTQADTFAAQICTGCVNLTNSLVGVSCPSLSLCLAIDPIGDVISSTNPLSTTPAWNITAVDNQWIPLDYVTCVSSTFCLAGPYFSVDPASSQQWQDAGFVYESAASCPAVSTCFAVAGDELSVGTYPG